FFFQAEDGIRDGHVTGVQTCALPIFAPVVAVVTTIDREHLDQYSSLEDIQDAFTQFVNRVPFYGAAILCLDEPNVQAIIPNVKRPILTYGVSSQADLLISDIRLDGRASE